MVHRIEPTMGGVRWIETNKEPVYIDKGASPKAEYDLIVIGAGYCGLSVALQAAKQGLSVALLEAGTVGCGASGRSGGFVVPHFPGGLTADDLIKPFGKARAERLAALIAGGPSYVFDLIREHDIKCDPEQPGWIQPAHSTKSLKRVKKAYNSWRNRGVDVEWLNAAALHERTGASGYVGGWYRSTGGTVNPYALALGLARVVSDQGVHIREGAAVTSIRRDGAAQIVTSEAGEYKAQKVAITTNGYTPALYPGLQQSVIPLRLYHVMTRPLLDNERGVTMPSRIPFTDLRKSGGFIRLDVENRVVSGGAVFNAGNQPAYGKHHAQARIAEIFPQLKGIEIEHYWEGYCALTDAFLPAIQQLDHNVYSVVGFSTRGVALTQTLGREMALFLAEKKTADEMPVRVCPVERIFMQGTKQLLGGLAFPVFQARDALGLT